MTGQPTLFDAPALSPTQQECLEALRWLIVPGDTSDIQRALAEHNIPRATNCIAKRLTELERLGHVERVGRRAVKGVTRTVWRRK